MRLGIVGSEGAKFTPESEARARNDIRWLILGYKATEVVSGRCHLGGIDIWAVEEARKLNIPVKEYPPTKKSWKYYKERNILIAKRASAVICLTVDRLPEGFKGMRFRLCYHCGTTNHVKSGGCWTANYARDLGKEGRIIVIQQGQKRGKG